MSKRQPITGRVIGQLTVRERVRIEDGVGYYRCTCECGNEVELSSHSLSPRDGNRSCGCVWKSNVAAASRGNKHNLRHGMSYHPLMRSWRSMVQRCENRNHPRYRYYGGRGVTICKSWREDPSRFFSWAKKNGWAPGLTVDRKNPKRGYTPRNCQFLTRSENALKMNRERREKKKRITSKLTNPEVRHADRPDR